MTVPDVEALLAQVQAQQDEVLRIQKSVEKLDEMALDTASTKTTRVRA